MKVKIDKNFLNNAMYLPNKKDTNTRSINLDNNYKITFEKKIPNVSDMQILLVLIHESQKRNFNETVNIKYNDITELLDIKKSGKTNRKIDDSLECLRTTQYIFNDSFYSSKIKVSKKFIVVDKVKRTKDGLSVKFNIDFINQIKNSKYYQFINLKKYTELNGVAARIMEILSGKFDKKKTFKIGAKKLGNKIPIVFEYARDVIKSVKRVKAQLESNGIMVNIEAGRKDRNLTFLKINPIVLFCEQEVLNDMTMESNEKLFPEDKQMKELFSLLKNKTKTIQKVVEKYYCKEGYFYVRSNILYTNKHSKKSYSTYLQRSLKENWGENWMKENEEIRETINEREKVEIRKREEIDAEKENTLSERLRFKEMHDRLNAEIKLEFMRKAETKIQRDKIGRGLLVKILYVELTVNHFNGQGENFAINIITKDVEFVKVLTKNIDSNKDR